MRKVDKSSGHVWNMSINRSPTHPKSISHAYTRSNSHLQFSTNWKPMMSQIQWLPWSIRIAWRAQSMDSIHDLLKTTHQSISLHSKQNASRLHPETLDQRPLPTVPPAGCHLSPPIPTTLATNSPPSPWAPWASPPPGAAAVREGTTTMGAP